MLKSLNLPHDGRRGFAIDAYMRVKGHDDVWGIVDYAANVDENGDPVPPNAQAAVQQGEAVARNILATIGGADERLSLFMYRPVGQLVDVGRASPSLR